MRTRAVPLGFLVILLALLVALSGCGGGIVTPPRNMGLRLTIDEICVWDWPQLTDTYPDLLFAIRLADSVTYLPGEETAWWDWPDDGRWYYPLSNYAVLWDVPDYPRDLPLTITVYDRDSGSDYDLMATASHAVNYANGLQRYRYDGEWLSVKYSIEPFELAHSATGSREAVQPLGVEPRGPAGQPTPPVLLHDDD